MGVPSRAVVNQMELGSQYQSAQSAQQQLPNQKSSTSPVSVVCWCAHRCPPQQPHTYSV